MNTHSRRLRTALLAAAASWAAFLPACTAPDGPAAGEFVSFGQRGDGVPAVEDRDPVIVSRGRWASGGDGGQVLRTEHYRLYTSVARTETIERAAEFLESALQHYRTALTPLPEPDLPMETYLLANRPQWERITLRVLGEDGREVLSLVRGGFATRGIGVFHDIGDFDTLAIAAHEGWHQYTQRTFPDPLPAWLEEGIATYMEGHRWVDGEPVFLPWANVERFDRLRTLVAEDNLIDLSEIFGQTPQEGLALGQDRLLDYYAQVWAFVHFLREGDGGRYAGQLQLLLADASTGQLEESLRTSVGKQLAREAIATREGPIIASVYFDGDLDGLNRRYQQFMRDIVRTGARDRIVRGESPVVAN